MIKPYLKEIENLDFLTSKSNFHIKNWQDSKDLNYSIKLLLENIFSQFEDGISRQNIIDSLKLTDDPNFLIKGFLMTMIWGHGYSKKDKNSKSDNRGPWKVSKMLLDFPNKILSLKKIFDYLNQSQLRNACLEFASFERCKISFYSKYLYFLGKSINPLKYPLIFDARVATTMIKLEMKDISLCELVEIKPNQNVDSYLSYVERIQNLALDYRLEADNIEYFLFKGINFPTH